MAIITIVDPSPFVMPYIGRSHNQRLDAHLHACKTVYALKVQRTLQRGVAIAAWVNFSSFDRWAVNTRT